ncbi:hypothetical protein Zmor_006054 [Zophobas morio]|uniref:Uncharacterized protein n=1 Tax=Zophobas morio TaxID=2755281 RepID=A0AA38IQY9_9CUCU|nr:hypothetical protein Zmor_006054 [Zophobas morio]
MNGDNIAEATGLLVIMKNEEFRFSLIFLKKILETTEPADKICQTRESSLSDAQIVLNSVMQVLKDYRSDNVFEDILNTMTQDCDAFLCNYTKEKKNQYKFKGLPSYK